MIFKLSLRPGQVEYMIGDPLAADFMSDSTFMLMKEL